ncbi:TetR/AcrR family transcriptional regulator [Pedobacter sp. KBW06]|uniref:TetR/AcrR family transcriptional regulator n=1 Tax=Pedobacter sp. KBW06 TaxID=2153359 RepID=UPI000F5A55F9|nr:TetR/AcrR family transcriptional regulator [Pedobacter sp. KBW06]RQO66011.1 TetR/AcrR family transcriptional regulator [Pedobacter sp. KBW06]
MERKIVEGVVRNKEKSKEKFLNAVGKILRTKGFSALKVNDIAAVAGLDKKLIYNYFGGTDQLIDEYIKSQDFWSNVKNEPDLDINDGGQGLSKAMLLWQFDYVFKNKELQKIILWGLLENRSSLKKLADDREESGDALFKNISDPHFGEHSWRYRAIMALLISGIYYLDIYASTNDNTFCGLNVKTEEGRKEIEEALSFMIDKVYESK